MPDRPVRSPHALDPGMREDPAAMWAGLTTAYDAFDRRARVAMGPGVRFGRLADIRAPVSSLIYAYVEPSFRPAVAYEIWRVAARGDLRGAPAGALIATRRTWRAAEDRERWRAIAEVPDGTFPLEPTIERAEGPLAIEACEPLLAAFAAVSLPAIAHGTTGLDGVRYELHVGDGGASARYSWWSEAPPGWRPLAQLLHDVARLADGALGKAPAQPPAT